MTVHWLDKYWFWDIGGSKTIDDLKVELNLSYKRDLEAQFEDKVALHDRCNLTAFSCENR